LLSQLNEFRCGNPALRGPVLRRIDDVNEGHLASERLRKLDTNVGGVCGDGTAI
jgi:hypothetical protein